MKSTITLFAAALMFAALAGGAWAENPRSDSPAAKAPATTPAAPPITAADIQALKDALAAQQQQIEALEQELHNRDHGPNSAAPEASPEISPESQPANAATPKNGIAEGFIAAQQSPQTSGPEEPQTFNKEMEGPLTIHFRGINITPGGYAAGEFVRRSRALGADLPTPFNSVSMPGASQSQVSEFFGSGRQSKITTFVDGHMKNVHLSSYVSADFLSAGVTSTSTETDSYTLRLRQAWGQARFDNGWSFLGGQEWSLLTENGKGISPDDDLGRTNDARPKTIDPSYSVGFVFARQYGIRVTKNFGDVAAFAVALENPQGTLTTHGNGDNFLLGEAGASNSYNTTSTYTFNPAPDIIAKLAFDPAFGHYEIFGLYDRFTDRIFPCGEVKLATGATTGPCPDGVGTGPSAAGAYNASKDGGGAGASARWKLPAGFTFGVKGFGGRGIGRYAPGGLADVTIHANGTLNVMKNLEGLSTLEWHSKKLDLYFYTGAEYAGRAYDFDAISGKEVGYGAPLFSNYGCYLETAPTVNTGFAPGTLANCTADTRVVIEGTGGFWYRFYSGPRGRFQFGTQYSYLTRQTWSGAGLTKGTSVAPEGIDNMVFVSFRYYLP
jgi:hypothetical protein